MTETVLIGENFRNGKLSSNLDVRGIVAPQLNESSIRDLAGVARNRGANMFGFGAFDSNPDNAKKTLMMI